MLAMCYLKRGKALLNSRYFSVFVRLFTNLHSTDNNNANAPEVFRIPGICHFVVLGICLFSHWFEFGSQKS